jgi:hypothetical protein
VITLEQLAAVVRESFPNAELSNTGGGCWAIVVPWDESHALITDFATDSNWQLGWYDSADSELHSRWFEADDYEAIVATLDRWTDGDFAE